MSPWLMIVNTAWEQQYGHEIFLGHIEWQQKSRLVYAGSTPTIAMTRVLLGMVFEMESFPDDDWFFPRGGMKESGIGRENGLEAYESCK